jgi:hypothetical protein
MNAMLVSPMNAMLVNRTRHSRRLSRRLDRRQCLDRNRCGCDFNKCCHGCHWSLSLAVPDSQNCSVAGARAIEASTYSSLTLCRKERQLRKNAGFIYRWVVLLDNTTAQGRDVQNWDSRFRPLRRDTGMGYRLMITKIGCFA